MGWKNIKFLLNVFELVTFCVIKCFNCVIKELFCFYYELSVTDVKMSRDFVMDSFNLGYI